MPTIEKTSATKRRESPSKQRGRTTRGFTIRGSVIPEFAIVLPVLLLFCGVIMDLGMALTSYLKVSQVAYEAARFGARLPNLETTGVVGEIAAQCTSMGDSGAAFDCTNAKFQYSFKNDTSVKPPVGHNDHERILARVNTLMGLENMQLDRATGWDAQTRFDPASQLVTVMISAAYTPFMPSMFLKGDTNGSVRMTISAVMRQS